MLIFLYQPHIYKLIIGIVILNISKDVLSYNLDRLATYVIMLNLKNFISPLGQIKLDINSKFLLIVFLKSLSIYRQLRLYIKKVRLFCLDKLNYISILNFN